MRQIQQPRAQQSAGPGGDPFDASSANTAELAMITHGPYAEEIPIAGLTVGQVRRRFRDRYQIPQEGIGMLDGEEVAEDTVITAGQLLTFIHTVNKKGVGWRHQGR